MGSVVAFLSPSAPPNGRTARVMLAASPHRGVDVDVVTQGSVVLGVSNSPSRADASLSVSDGVAAAFVGVLDNAQEMAASLQELGMVVDAESPAEIVGAAFRAFGLELPRRLRGFFAVAVTDGSRLFCFRDHLGLGTLYYRRDANGVYAATEAKQVIAGAGISSEPDPEVIEEILFQSFDNDTPCALRGALRLPKASSMLVDRDRLRVGRYWEPERLLESARLGPDEIADRFEVLMQQAVDRTLTGNDAVSLSGGVDSPAVAAFAAPRHQMMSGRPLTAISVVYPDLPTVDESSYVALVADYLHIPLHTYRQTAKPLDGLREWVRITDGPVPTVSLPQYEDNYREVRTLGCSTVLTGEIAELVFDTRSYLIHHLMWAGRIGALRKQRASLRARGVRPSAFRRQILSGLAPAFVTRFRVSRDRLGVPDWVDLRRANAPGAGSVVAPRHRWRRVQLDFMQRPGISMEADDICQELAGVRCRRPFADVDLWEFFLSLRAEAKFPDTGSKTLVRKLLRGRVPDAILDRRDKTVFNDDMLKRIDYPTLRHFLIDPPYRFRGIDYGGLRDRLEKEACSVVDLLWAKDLASAHAFLSLW